MDNNSTYFYISGFISFSLFGIILVLFVFTLFDVKKIDSYGLKKDNYISISLDMPLVTNQKKKNVKSAPSESVSETPTKNIDVNDLFNDVWTKTIAKNETKKVNSKRIMDIQQKIKKVKSNSVESISEKVNNLDNVKSNQEENAASTANEVNEYLAKIQAIVYQYFNVPANSEGNSVKIVIELNALGKVLGFRVLEYSSNSALNDEVDKIKERLRSVIFPINPQNKSSRTVVILISKE